jgi:hypothetical protein
MSQSAPRPEQMPKRGWARDGEDRQKGLSTYSTRFDQGVVQMRLGIVQTRLGEGWGRQSLGLSTYSQKVLSRYSTRFEHIQPKTFEHKF